MSRPRKLDVRSSQVTRIFYRQDPPEGFAIVAGFENHPVTGVTWYGAWSYCVFYGCRLPTEAEWEVAARGENRDWAYPFSEELSAKEGPRRANYSGARGPGEPFYRTTTPVGFFDGCSYQGFQTWDSPSFYGLYDMSGNVAEWVSDWYGPYPAYDQFDPQGPPSGEFKVDRGGSYEQTRDNIRVTGRNGESDLEQGFATIGFRPVFVVSGGVP